MLNSSTVAMLVQMAWDRYAAINKPKWYFLIWTTQRPLDTDTLCFHKQTSQVTRSLFTSFISLAPSQKLPQQATLWEGHRASGSTDSNLFFRIGWGMWNNPFSIIFAKKWTKVMNTILGNLVCNLIWNTKTNPTIPKQTLLKNQSDLSWHTKLYDFFGKRPCFNMQTSSIKTLKVLSVPDQLHHHPDPYSASVKRCL